MIDLLVRCAFFDRVVSIITINVFYLILKNRSLCFQHICSSFIKPEFNLGLDLWTLINLMVVHIGTVVSLSNERARLFKLRRKAMISAGHWNFRLSKINRAVL